MEVVLLETFRSAEQLSGWLRRENRIILARQRTDFRQLGATRSCLRTRLIEGGWRRRG